MDCVRAQKLIRPYLDGKLSDRELEEFLDHVDSCPACHDELEIYFSIYQTLGEETDDGDYNFTRKLDEKLQRSEQYLTRRHIFRSMKIVLIVCAELFFIADDSIAYGAHILDMLNHVKPANPENENIVLPEDIK